MRKNLFGIHGLYFIENYGDSVKGIIFNYKLKKHLEHYSIIYLIVE